MKCSTYIAALLIAFSATYAYAIPPAEVRFPPQIIPVQEPVYKGTLDCYPRTKPL